MSICFSFPKSTFKVIGSVIVSAIEKLSPLETEEGKGSNNFTNISVCLEVSSNLILFPTVFILSPKFEHVTPTVTPWISRIYLYLMDHPVWHQTQKVGNEKSPKND